MGANLAVDTVPVKEFIGIKDALEILDVSRTTLWSMKKRGEVPEFTLPTAKKWLRRDFFAFYENKSSALINRQEFSKVTTKVTTQ